MNELKKTDRTRVRRIPARGSYDRSAADAILDEALICHVGFVVDAQPFVIPTIHARVDAAVYIHGAPASRLLKTLAEGVPVSLTATLVDGLVLARSAFHHSMNYRSVMLLGTATLVDEPAEKLEALRVMTERLQSGRWEDCRRPTEKELRATKVLRLPIDEASVKTREGPPSDDDEDYELPHWAGIVPVSVVNGAPVADPRLTEGIALPDYLRKTP